MIRWLMRTLFGMVPTCKECGHQMPDGPYEVLYYSGSGSDVSASRSCHRCRAGWWLHYEPYDWRIPQA